MKSLFKTLVSVSSASAFTCRMILGNRRNSLLAQEPSVVATYNYSTSSHYMFGGVSDKPNCVSEDVIVAELLILFCAYSFYRTRTLAERCLSHRAFRSWKRYTHRDCSLDLVVWWPPATPPGLARLSKHHHSFCYTCSENQGLFQASFLVPQRFLGVCPLQNTCTLGATSSSVQHPPLRFVPITNFSTLAWLPPLKSLCFMSACTATFSSRTLSLPQLSLCLLQALRAAAQVSTLSALTLPCFGAVQEIQRSPFFPFCSSNELCDATQLLIFSGIVAEVH